MKLFSREIDHEVDLLKWNPTGINRKGPKLSHHFFADDLTLFVKANKDNCKIIRKTLDSFNTFSGKKNNRTKSKVLFSRNYSSNTCKDLTSILDNNYKNTFGKYLRFPIFDKDPNNADFQFIIDNIR